MDFCRSHSDPRTVARHCQICQVQLHARWQSRFGIHADKYEHLVRYCGYYSNCSRGARKQANQTDEAAALPIIDELPVYARRKTNRARLIQQVYEIDPLECPNCSATMRIIALIDDPDSRGVFIIR